MTNKTLKWLDNLWDNIKSSQPALWSIIHSYLHGRIRVMSQVESTFDKVLKLQGLLSTFEIGRYLGLQLHCIKSAPLHSNWFQLGLSYNVCAIWMFLKGYRKSFVTKVSSNRFDLSNLRCVDKTHIFVISGCIYTYPIYSNWFHLWLSMFMR